MNHYQSMHVLDPPTPHLIFFMFSFFLNINYRKRAVISFAIVKQGPRGGRNLCVHLEYSNHHNTGVLDLKIIVYCTMHVGRRASTSSL